MCHHRVTQENRGNHMGIILRLLFGAIVPLLANVGWIIGIMAVQRFGRRLWRWFWS